MSRRSGSPVGLMGAGVSATMGSCPAARVAAPCGMPRARVLDHPPLHVDDVALVHHPWSRAPHLQLASGGPHKLGLLHIALQFKAAATLRDSGPAPGSIPVRWLGVRGSGSRARPSVPKSGPGMSMPQVGRRARGRAPLRRGVAGLVVDSGGAGTLGLGRIFQAQARGVHVAREVHATIMLRGSPGRGGEVRPRIESCRRCSSRSGENTACSSSAAAPRAAPATARRSSLSPADCESAPATWLDGPVDQRTVGAHDPVDRRRIGRR